MGRNLERVTCKVALYNMDYSKVLLVEYKKNEYGLPGGHTELNEGPEESLKRELKEELGLVTVGTVNKKDFWRHPDGKIVLGFTAQIPEETKIMIDEAEIRNIRWTLLTDIEHGAVTAGTYDRFILQNVLH